MSLLARQRLRLFEKRLASVRSFAHDVPTENPAVVSQPDSASLHTVAAPSADGALDSAEQSRWFLEQVQPHESSLRGYLRRQFPSVEVDDVIQESYVKLLQKNAKGGISSVKAYVFSIARNTARRIFRRRKLFSDTPVNELPDSCLLDQGRDGAELTNAQQQLELAIAAVASLPARCREIVTLAALHGLGNAEIAERLGLSENTVRVQMARGINKCTEYLERLGECQ